MSCQVRKMKMMAAASCNQRSPETQCAKEVAAKLQQIQAERAKQDQMWQQEPIKSISETSDLSYKNKCEVLPANSIE